MTALNLALSPTFLCLAIAAGLRVDSLARAGSRRGTNDREMGS